MSDARRAAVVSAIVAAGVLSACGPQRVRTPERPGQTLVVLLPDPDSNNVGSATVSNASGTVSLATARESTLVSASAPPSPAAVLSESEVSRIFDDALSALPPPPRQFTLYFRFESNELTDESRAMVPEILKAITGRAVPDLAIVGHTDTTGTPAANFALGRARALMVRDLLVNAGLDATVIDVASHGEAELQVPTADETLEPRNRRVEISVR
jgi:outer membrane protein OmpA-like peptidoglycan-associated protein